MPNSDLVNYIQQNRQQGQVDDQIRQALIQAGWQPADIESAFLDLTQPRYPSQTSSLPSSPGSEPTMTVVTELRSPIELLTQSWQIFTSRWKTLIIIAFIPIFFLIFYGFIGVVIMRTFMINNNDFYSSLRQLTQLPVTAWIFTVPTLIILGIFYLIIYSWGQLALMQTIKDH